METGSKTILHGSRLDLNRDGHYGSVLDVTLVDNSSTMLASAGADQMLRVWDLRAFEKRPIHSLRGHTQAVTCVAADPDEASCLVYTASLDKTLKIWNLKSFNCVGTLFGHIEGVTCMDIVKPHRPLTGGSDETVRVFKTLPQTHLVYKETPSCVDSVHFQSPSTFLSGHFDGSIRMWNSTSRSPHNVSKAHKSGVSAICTIRNSDASFSASNDGHINIWKTDFKKSTSVVESHLRNSDGSDCTSVETKPLELMQRIDLDCPCWVNQLKYNSSKKMLVGVVAQEQRLGRWDVQNQTSNGLFSVRISDS
eukprot:Filipodium_phascolosomae@DN1987_c0_g1_i1.p1